MYFRNKIEYTLREDVTNVEIFYTDSADDVRVVNVQSETIVTDLGLTLDKNLAPFNSIYSE